MFILRNVAKLFIVLLLPLLTAPAARGACSGAPPMLKDMLKAATQTTDVYGQIPTGYTRAIGELGRPLTLARTAAITSKVACECAASTSVGACVANEVDKQFLCEMLDLAPFNPTNPFSVMSVFFPPVGIPLAVAYDVYYGDAANPFCDGNNGSGGGSADFVCCKRSTAALGCVYGSDPTNIGCLGAPPIGYVVGAGSFNAIGKPSCDHVAECAVGTQVADQRPYSKAERLNEWTRKLSGAYAQAAYGSRSPTGASSSACTADFAMMTGCRGFFEILRQGQPFLSIDSAPADFGAYEMSTAAQRVIFAIPNGIERYDYVKSRIWTSQSQQAYLDKVDALAELSAWLSPCGLELLQASLPDRWELLAVPTPDEAPIEEPRDPNEWVDGCLQGEPPTELSAIVTRDGQTVTVDVHVVDPEADHAGGDIMPLSVGWDANTVTGEIFLYGHQNLFSHTYSGPLPSTVKVGYVNGAGFSLIREVPVP